MTLKDGNPRARRAAEEAAQQAAAQKAEEQAQQAAAHHEAVAAYRATRYPRQRVVPEGVSETTADRMSNATQTGAAAYAHLRKKRKRKKVIIAALCSVLVIALVGAGVAFAYYMSIQSNMKKGVDSDLLAALSTTDTPGDPFYILLLGIDGSLEREQDAEFAGDAFRSDSMMLARIDPQNKKATLVSIRRDLKIEDMAGYGEQKINAAHALGGPALAVKTVSELAGVPISHYAEINFDGFKDIVDALGGIEVDVPIAIDDREAGQPLKAGLQTLDGDQALVLCRSRNAYADYGDGDNYRAANQRIVLAAIAQKLLASDPITIANTISALSKNIVTDLDVSEIISIAQNMRGMNMETDIYSGATPATSEYTDDIWYDILNQSEWKAMMKRVDAGQPPEEETVIDPYTGTVMATAGDGTPIASGEGAVNRKAKIIVRNGNGTTGACESAVQVIKSLGYSKTDIGNADAFNYDETVIIYKEDKDLADAKAIAEGLKVGEVIADDQTFLFEGDVLVVLGADWIY